MSPRKRRHKRDCTYLTGHRRAVADSQVSELISKLRDAWPIIDRVERGERLRELLALGCSARGLEKELGQSATSVRRHLELANLSEVDRRAVKDGASAKKILEKKALLDRRKRRQKRIEDDQRTGVLSDEIADIMLDFCRETWRRRLAPILPSEISVFLDNVATDLSEFEATGRSAIKATKRLGIPKLITRSRPPIVGDPFWMAYQAEWLAKIVWAKAKERPIWENAIKKAGRRADELAKKKKRPIELFRESRDRREKLGSAPVRRKYQGEARQLL